MLSRSWSQPFRACVVPFKCAATAIFQGAPRLSHTISALKEVTTNIPEAVESIRKRRLQPLHAGDEVSLRRFKRQVKVIPHDDKAMEEPSAPCTRFEEAGFERGLGRFVLENPTPVIAAIDHVIDCPGKLQT